MGEEIDDELPDYILLMIGWCLNRFTLTPYGISPTDFQYRKYKYRLPKFRRVFHPPILATWWRQKYPHLKITTGWGFRDFGRAKFKFHRHITNIL